MKIEIQYILEAKRIIQSYNKVTAQLTTFQKTLNDNKDSLLSIVSEIEDIQGSQDTDLLKKQKLYDIMLTYDKDINKLQHVIKPYIDEIEQLKKDSTTLYTILKDKYPGLTDKELQEYIFNALDEMKKEA